MQVLNSIADVRQHLPQLICAGSSVGFVPTMGALHAGHASLVADAARDNDIVVVSIFVNPTQFGPNEDLDQYPRTLEADFELCEEHGATHVFTPTEAMMYPEGKQHYEVQLSLRSMDQMLCGAKRPGHFDGVLQVVSKLFNIVRPTRAYFGQKDFQQVTILKRLQQELFFPLEVVECPIIREEDGLAMSSRNRYLNPEEREQSLFLSRALAAVCEQASDGLPTADLSAMVHEMAKGYSLIKIDYFEIRSARDLIAPGKLNRADEPRALIAAFCGSTRLIDNRAIF